MSKSSGSEQYENEDDCGSFVNSLLEDFSGSDGYPYEWSAQTLGREVQTGHRRYTHNMKPFQT